MKSSKLRGFLINPWKRELTEVQVEDDLHAWYKLLHCQYVDSCRIAHVAGRTMVVLVDETGLLNDPPAPFFVVKGYPEKLCGYGLVLCLSRHGKTLSIPDCVSLATFGQAQGLLFEVWEQRIDPRDVDPEHII